MISLILSLPYRSSCTVEPALTLISQTRLLYLRRSRSMRPARIGQDNGGGSWTKFLTPARARLVARPPGSDGTLPVTTSNITRFSVITLRDRVATSSFPPTRCLVSLSLETSALCTRGSSHPFCSRHGCPLVSLGSHPLTHRHSLSSSLVSVAAAFQPPDIANTLHTA